MSTGDPQDFNRYTHVQNDPINSVDPTGLMLSDIGVYQTMNPEVARKVERAEDQGLRNWVAARSGNNGTSKNAQRQHRANAIQGGAARRNILTEFLARYDSSNGAVTAWPFMNSMLAANFQEALLRRSPMMNLCAL